jgi:hypothetical protein
LSTVGEIEPIGLFEKRHPGDRRRREAFAVVSQIKIVKPSWTHIRAVITDGDPFASARVIVNARQAKNRCVLEYCSGGQTLLTNEPDVSDAGLDNWRRGNRHSNPTPVAAAAYLRQRGKTKGG